VHSGPPIDAIGTTLAFGRVLAHGAGTFLVLAHAIVHHEGALLQLDALTRPAGDGEPDPLGFMSILGRTPAAELPQFTVRYDDGRTAHALGGVLPASQPDSDAPLLIPQGGNGGPGRWTLNLWSTPLPERGDLHLEGKWSAAGLAFETQLGGGALRVAARTAVRREA